MEHVPIALALATSLAEGAPFSAPPTRRARWSVTAAMGDPQAPLEAILSILAHHGLLADHGRLRDDVRLVSIGDHFDWGPVEDRARAAYDGLRTIAWLASHPADQVVLLAGNHDLARVGELARFTDEQYERARSEADQGYRHARPARPEAHFRDEYELPSWEVAARDLSAFRSAQREWVAALLRAGRLRLACSLGGVLLTHAGVSTHELDALGLSDDARADPDAVSDALEARLAKAVRGWRAEPFRIPQLHAPGDAQGEGAGMLYHRFSTRDEGAWSVRPDGLRRRTAVRDLAPSLVQAIGHVRDKKSLSLLGLDPSAATVGRLRTLAVHDGRWRYETEVRADQWPAHSGVIVHLDGAMLEAEPERYELFDLDRLAPLVSRAL
jgi:hypothetical protein